MLSALLSPAALAEFACDLWQQQHDRTRNGSIWQKNCEMHSILVVTGASNHSSTVLHLCKDVYVYCRVLYFASVPEHIPGRHDHY